MYMVIHICICSFIQGDLAFSFKLRTTLTRANLCAMIISNDSKFSLSYSKETTNIRNIEMQDTKIPQNVGMEIEDKDNFM